MGGPHTKIRRHGKVHSLPDELRAEVDRLLIEGNTYEDIEKFLKRNGYDISKSSIGRYGKEFLNFYREVKIIEDQSKTLVSEAGGDGMIILEAAEKLFSKKIVELLLQNQIDVTKIPRIVSDFAKLQASSVVREKMKAEFKRKAEKAFQKAEKQAKKMSKEELIKMLRQEVYGLV